MSAVVLPGTSEAVTIEEAQRRILTMRRDGKSMRRIASDLGLSVSEVHDWLKIALQRLRA